MSEGRKPRILVADDQRDVLAALQAEAASGTRIAYCGDPMLETVLVVKR